MKEITQIRKKRGLSSIVVSKGTNGREQLLKASEYEIEESDLGRPEATGTYVGESQQKMFPKAKQGVVPMKDRKTGFWLWGGTPQDFVETVSKLKGLLYPKWHSKAGQLIDLKSVTLEDERINPRSPIFGQDRFMSGYYVEADRKNLNPDNPYDVFMYYCIKGNSKVSDNTSNKPVSKYALANANYELISNRVTKKKKVDNFDLEVEAISLLANMKNNEQKLRAIAEIMKLPGYSRKTTDLNALYLLVGQKAAKAVEKASRFKNKTFQERFIELAKMDTEELNIRQKIFLAKRERILAQKGN